MEMITRNKCKELQETILIVLHSLVKFASPIEYKVSLCRLSISNEIMQDTYGMCISMLIILIFSSSNIAGVTYAFAFTRRKNLCEIESSFIFKMDNYLFGCCINGVLKQKELQWMQ